MASHYRCRQGHLWKSGTQPDASVRCPVCGETVEDEIDMQALPGLDDNVRPDSEPTQRIRLAAATPTTAAPTTDGPPALGSLAVPWAAIPGYEILGELGRGGMGVVYKARQIQLNRFVALKMVLAGGHAGRDRRDRFRAEAEAVARMQHPNIVPLYEIGEHEGRPYFTLELVEGGSLEALITRPPLLPRQAAKLIEDVARAVHYAHCRGIVHRDLKPANILLEARSQEPGARAGAANRLSSPAPGSRLLAPKITDFGLAKYLDDETPHTQTGVILGTPAYMAPEQAQGDPRKIGPLADVYALGAILYELATGKPVFHGRSMLDTLDQVRHLEPVPPRRVQPSLPLDLQTICLKCLEKEQHKRYASALDLAEDLRRFQADEPIAARPIRTPERLWRWCRRKPLLAGLTAALVLALVGGFVGVTWKWREAETHRAAAEDAQHVAELRQEQADQARRDMQRFSARLVLERGSTLAEQGNLGWGLLTLARGLEYCPREETALEQSLRQLLGGWSTQLHPQRVVMPHDAWVNAVAFSPDNRTVLTGCTDGSARLWKLDAAAVTGVPPEAPSVLMRHDERITAVAFAPTGKTVATASTDHTARVWDADTGVELHVFRHGGGLRALAYSPDGRTLVTGGKDYMARLWDVATGQSIGEPLRHTGDIRAVAFSPDGRQVLTGSDDFTARLWDAATGRPLGEPLRQVDAGHAGSVRAVAFTPDGKTVVTAGNDRTARLWDAATGQPRGTPLVHPKPVAAVAFSPDSNMLLTGCEDKTARLWDVATGRDLHRRMMHQEEVVAVAYSPDGRFVASSGEDKTARLWLAATGEPWGEPLRHQDHVGTLAFSSDGRTLLTGSEDHTARLWAIESGSPAGRSLGPRLGAVYALAFSHDGKTLLSAGSSARLLDARTGELVSEISLPDKFSLAAAAFSPDSRALLLSGYSRTAYLVDRATGKVTAQLVHPNPSWVLGAAFSPDGKTVATASGNFDARGKPELFRSEVQLWEAATGAALRTLKGHGREVTAVAFSPDGKTLVTGSRDRTARLWDVAAGQQIGEPLAHPEWIEAVAFSPDGRLIVTAGNDKTARVWDAAAGRQAIPPLRHGEHVHAVTFSPDGRLILTGGGDHAARLWDAFTGKPVGPPLRHDVPVRAVAFGLDGRTFVTGTENGLVRLWTTPRPLAGDARYVRLWAEVATGAELEASGDRSYLNETKWRERYQLLVTTGNGMFLPRKAPERSSP